MITFKGAHYPKPVILYAVFFYVRFAVSYRELEIIMAERGVPVDHATLNRWVVKYAPQIARRAQKRKRPVARSWRMDETYIQVKGRWCYLYRAVDKHGDTVDFMLSERRDAAAARRFFKHSIETNGPPEKVVIDKSGANLAGLLATNVIHKITVTAPLIDILQVKFLNNIVEQDQRFIKRTTRLMLGFKSLTTAQATLAGIETAHMVRKRQIDNAGDCPFRIFTNLAG